MFLRHDLREAGSWRLEMEARGIEISPRAEAQVPSERQSMMSEYGPMPKFKAWKGVRDMNSGCRSLKEVLIPHISLQRASFRRLSELHSQVPEPEARGDLGPQDQFDFDAHETLIPGSRREEVSHVHSTTGKKKRAHGGETVQKHAKAMKKNERHEVSGAVSPEPYVFRGLRQKPARPLPPPPVLSGEDVFTEIASLPAGVMVLQESAIATVPVLTEHTNKIVEAISSRFECF